MKKRPCKCCKECKCDWWGINLCMDCEEVTNSYYVDSDNVFFELNPLICVLKDHMNNNITLSTGEFIVMRDLYLGKKKEIDEKWYKDNLEEARNLVKRK